MLLFDREEKLIGTLKDIITAKHTEEINGENILEIITLDTNIEKEYKVLYKSIYGYWNEFIVKGIEEEHTNEGIERTLYCENSL